jgi:hypothetical protein
MDVDVEETWQADDESSAETAAGASGSGASRRLPHLPNFTITALIVWLTIYATVGARLYVPRGPGQAVPLAGVLTVLLVSIILASNQQARTFLVERTREAPWLLALVSVWTVLSLAGPVVGYPIHTLFTAFTPLSLAALCSIGLLLSAQSGAPVRRLYVPLIVVAWIQFAVGAMQALWYTGVLTLPPQRWLYLWDMRASVAYGVEQIVGRSVGLYLNPNPYSLLGAILLVFALTLNLRLRQRMALGLPAVGIVLLGASRGVVLALVVAVIPWAVYKVRGLKRSRRLPAASAVGAAALLFIAVAQLPGNVLYSRFASRWASVPDLLTIGAGADANAAGRVQAWERIMSYWAKHPLGTYGPPQMAISSFTDNDYITFLLQGGIILLAAYLGTLGFSLARRRESPLGPSIAPLIGVVALTGLTQTSAILVPALALFWPAIGTTMAPAAGNDLVLEIQGPRRAAASERTRRRFTAALGGTLVLLVLAAIGMRVVGVGFKSPLEVVPGYTRPSASAEATVTVPGWRVQAGERLGMYYVDLPLSERPDRVDDLKSPRVSPAEEARFSRVWKPATASIRGQDQVIAVAVAISGVRDYTRFVATGDPRFAASSRRAADWLVREQEPDGSWRYQYAVFDLAPGWASANVQSVAISLLARAYQDSGKEKYLSAAERAYTFMLTPVADGGVLGAFPDKQPVLQGYRSSSVADDVLSGAVVGLFGIRDLAVVTGDAEIRDRFEKLSDSLGSHLAEYDIGGWSRYSLGIARGPSSHVFHRLYVVELRALGELTGDERFERQADRWQASLVQWIASFEGSAQ